MSAVIAESGHCFHKCLNKLIFEREKHLPYFTYENTQIHTEVDFPRSQGQPTVDQGAM